MEEVLKIRGGSSNIHYPNKRIHPRMKNKELKKASYICIFLNMQLVYFCAKDLQNKRKKYWI